MEFLTVNIALYVSSVAVAGTVIVISPAESVTSVGAYRILHKTLFL